MGEGHAHDLQLPVACELGPDIRHFPALQVDYCSAMMFLLATAIANRLLLHLVGV